MRNPLIIVLILAFAIAFVGVKLADAAIGCEQPRPADCRVYEDTHTCISRLDERRREIENAVARALTNLE